MIHEFVQTRPSFQSLTLIPTTRSVKKSRETVAALQKHLRKLDEKWEENLSNRVTIQPEAVDLTFLSSVHALATKLLVSIPHLDTIICNAGYGGTIGIDWPKCFWSLATDTLNALTYPQYKISGIGYTTAPQGAFTRSDSSDDGLSLDESRHIISDGSPTSQHQQPLGKVFASNVFGHYLLNHLLLPLLTASPDAGRIIWTSSLEAVPEVFHRNDIQALTTDKAYESSKRLTDILVLTSALPCTSPFVKRYLTPPITNPESTDSDDGTSNTPGIHLQDNEPSKADNDDDNEADEPLAPRISLTDHTHTNPSTHSNPSQTPAIYLTHPGICATNFVPLPSILQLLMALAFLFARWLGSPWHTVSTWKGAKAPVWLALASREEMEDMEIEGGRGKWGSCVDRWGREGVRRTEVVGWGSGGQVHGDGSSDSDATGARAGVGGGKRVGDDDDDDDEDEKVRKKDAAVVVKKATRQEREEFEDVGRECWREMETLRVAWEERLSIGG